VPCYTRTTIPLDLSKAQAGVLHETLVAMGFNAGAKESWSRRGVYVATINGRLEISGYASTDLEKLRGEIVRGVSHAVVTQAAAKYGFKLGQWVGNKVVATRVTYGR
jgi:hypothetical protein